MKKRMIIVFTLLLIAGAIGTGGWYYYTHNQVTTNEDVIYVTSIEKLTGESLGIQNRYAGVVEAQETVSVNIEGGRKVTEVLVKEGDVVKEGQLLFEYNLSSIQEELQEAELAMERLKNEALSLSEQIKTLEAEKKKASANNQLSYTIEIETNRMNLKKNEYDQVSKAAEIENLKNATVNTQVRSTIEGVIQKIDTSKMNTEDGDTMEGDSYMSNMSGDSSDNSFIKILSTGAYRVKGMINELNVQSLAPGEPIIIRSRADETQVWHGTMGMIDKERANSSSNEQSYDMYGSDSQTSSTTYPFYIELDSSEGLMLGQHVYIEKDNGQENIKDGVWLNEMFIVDATSASPYVWAADENERIEKRSVVLGNYDETLGEYEILEGLSKEDCIAFPSLNIEEGQKTVVGSSEETMASMVEEIDLEEAISEEGYIEDDYIDTDYSDADYMETEYIDEDYLESDYDFTDDGTYDYEYDEDYIEGDYDYDYIEEEVKEE